MSNPVRLLGRFLASGRTYRHAAALAWAELLLAGMPPAEILRALGPAPANDNAVEAWLGEDAYLDLSDEHPAFAQVCGEG